MKFTSQNLIRYIAGLISKKNIPILLILLIAAFLRFYRIQDYITFLGDEGRDALVVYNILHGKLTLLGPTASVGGFFLGPIYYYFMAPFLWLFNYNPVGPAVMVAIVGISTVWLVYKVGNDFFDKKAGIIAAALYAVSPLVIIYSRSSWNPNLMPFFTLFCVYTLYKAVKENNLLLFVISGISYGILLQLHYLETFFGVSVVLYILISGVIFIKGSLLKKIFGIAKSYLFTLIGFIIGFSPFLAFEVRHSFPNTRSIVDFIFNSKDTGTNEKFFDVTGDVFFRLFGRLLTRFPQPELINADKNLDISIWYYLTFILIILSILVFVFNFVKDIKQKRNINKYIILIIWFVIGIVLFGFYKRAIYDYYLQMLFPIPFLIVGFFLSTLFRHGKVFKIISVVIVAVLLLFNLYDSPIKYTPNKQMEQVKEISELVLSKTDNKPFNFALVTGGNSDHGYRYFMKLAKKDPIVIENFDNDPKRLTVTDQLLVICEDSNCKPLGHSLWEIAGFGRAEIKGEWVLNFVKVYKLAHYKDK